MNYNQLEKMSEINLDLEIYEDTIFRLQRKIADEKQKTNVNQSMLGRLRYKLKKTHDQYCELYLMKYEI